MKIKVSKEKGLKHTLVKGVIEQHVNVILIRDDLVDENYLFTDPKKAEKFFLDEIKKKGIALDEPEDTLADGYYSGANWAICLTWPTSIK